MAAYKRSDPKKLAKERAEIADSMAEQEKPRESTLSLIGKVIMGKIDARRRRARGYGAPPQVRGAMQHGFKKPDSTA